MVTYANEAEAHAGGFSFEHDAERHRFVVLQRRDAGEDRVVGEAHYTLLGDHGIDFDHTFVTPSMRGTGLSDLLAAHALTDELVHGRKIQASCWFIDAYLSKHPDVVRGGAGS